VIYQPLNLKDWERRIPSRKTDSNLKKIQFWILVYA